MFESVNILILYVRSRCSATDHPTPDLNLWVAASQLATASRVRPDDDVDWAEIDGHTSSYKALLRNDYPIDHDARPWRPATPDEVGYFILTCLTARAADERGMTAGMWLAEAGFEPTSWPQSPIGGDAAAIALGSPCDR
jgi:hypothetical protein